MSDFSHHEQHFSFELLADYVDGILDSKSNTRISAHLEKCEECADAVRNIRIYYATFGEDRDGLEAYLEESKNDILARVHQALGKEDEPVQARGLWYYASRIAATVLIIVVPAIILIFNNQTKSADALVKRYISSPYHKPPVTRGDSDQVMNLWREVAAKYENKDFQEALVVLDQIIAKKETLPMAHFYMSLCYLYGDTPQPNQAIVHLQKVVTNQNPYYEQGLWYLSLAYLQADEKELGKETLATITSYKQKEAQSLLNKLE